MASPLFSLVYSNDENIILFILMTNILEIGIGTILHIIVFLPFRQQNAE